MDNIITRPWPPFKRSGTEISPRTDTDRLSLSPTRSADAYSYGVKIDTDTFFTGGAATKSYLLSIMGDRLMTSAATGDSNDAYIKCGGSNYAANDANFILRGVNSAITNRDGGTMGQLIGGNVGSQNKSGGVVTTVKALELTAENYGTVGTEFSGLDLLMKNEGAKATSQYGIKVRNNGDNAGSVLDSAFKIFNNATSSFNYGIDLYDASVATVINTADFRGSAGDTISNLVAGTIAVSGGLSVGGRILGHQGVDVASANDITLTSGNYFDITGATTINGIATVGWTAGSCVILQFDGVPLVKHNTAASAGFGSILLSGAADFQTTAGDLLKLTFDGTYWREETR